MFKSVIFVFLYSASLMATALDYTHEITEQEIQEKVSALMPVVKKKYFVTITISNPKIDLIKKSDEIGIYADIKANVTGGINGSGQVMIKGSLEYNADKGEFYFKNPKIVSLAIDKVSNNIIPKIQGLAEAALSKVMTVRPVYKFKDDNLKHTLAKSVLKSLKVENEKLLLTLGVF